ncbi:PaaI family thioesterase [Rhodococcus triatomae]|nr:thioesterase [Rhodococcus triatomae BKS 15-14]
MTTGFNEHLGFTITESGPERVAATVVLGPEHHQPFGIVHGGVYCAIVETLASIGGSEYWTGPGRTVVGVNNNTDFLRAVSEGTLSAEALPIHRGRTQQLWAVTLTGEDGKLVARGQVRLANLERPTE